MKGLGKIQFHCDFCQKSIVDWRQNKRLFSSAVKSPKCKKSFSTVKDVFTLFHKVNGTTEHPSASVVCLKCSTILESLAVKVVDAKSVYGGKNPILTDHTYNCNPAPNADTGKKYF